MSQSPSLHSHPARPELNALASDVVRLSRLLTREREGLPTVYLEDRELRKAYLSYFLPANRSKIHLPLGELARHPDCNFHTKKTLRILDMGSGPGTASLGILDYFTQKGLTAALEFTAVDQSAAILREAEALFAKRRNETAIPASLKTIQADIGSLERYAQNRFDVIVMSNVLNELHSRAEGRIAKRVAETAGILNRHLVEDGSCIIIEPALRETSRDLLAVRDGLIDQGYHVYSPCLHEAPCPALENPKDWCHEEIFWDPPELVKEIDALTGLHKDALKFSYLVLRKDRLSLADVCGPDSYRVVSEPLVSKGKREFYLCGGGVRKQLTRLDKDASSLNQFVATMTRGNIITFRNLTDEGKRFKIVKDTSIVSPLSGVGHSLASDQQTAS